MIYTIETSKQLEKYMQENEGSFLSYLQLACVEPVLRRFKRNEIEKLYKKEIEKLNNDLKDDAKNITIKIEDKKLAIVKI